jgi:phage gp36-like protein
VAYSTLASVKEILQIEETSWDTELTNCIASADGLIDSILKYWSFTVPLSTVPQNIQDASAHFAAWMFRKRRDPAGAVVFWEEGNRFLQAYIDGEQNQPTLRRV